MDSSIRIVVSQDVQDKINVIIERQRMFNQSVGIGDQIVNDEEAVVSGAVELLYQFVVENNNSLRDALRASGIVSARIMAKKLPVSETLKALLNG